MKCAIVADEAGYHNLAREMRGLLRDWMAENKDGFLIRFDHLAEAKDKRNNT